MKLAIKTSLVIAVIATALATALTLPASADYKSVTVRMSDGSLQAFVVNVPAGASLQDIRTLVPGEPVSWRAAPAPASAQTNTATTTTPQPAPKPAHPAPKPKPTAPALPKGLQPSSEWGDAGKKGSAADRRARRKARRQGLQKPGKTLKASPKPRPKPKALPRPRRRPPARRPDGVPTPRSPGFMDALPGPATTTRVPNFVINKFRVPIFLLPIYQAAGTQYGVRWEVLAAINEIETDYGRNLNVSSAGALGWMQFMPSTWKTYGVDANKDGKKDPFNPVDAIFASARYLKAAGYEKSTRRAIFAYNHADWYVDSVMLRARLIAGVPTDLVGSLSGLTEGRFPVAARARYADGLQAADARKKAKRGQNAANVVNTDGNRQGIDIFAKRGSAVVATNDGVVKRIGRSRRLGRYVVVQDVYGNRFTYGHLGSTSRYYPVPKGDAGNPKLSAHALKAHKDPRPTAAASSGRQVSRFRRDKAKARRSGKQAVPSSPAPQASSPTKQRLFAHPGLPQARENGGFEQSMDSRGDKGGLQTYDNQFAKPVKLDSRHFKLRRLRKGAHVIGGTVLGRIGKPTRTTASRLYFEIRPAGKGAPRVDPKPILDGWKLLEATAVYRASGKNALRGSGASIGQVLLMSKSTLEKRVLADPRVDVYSGGREDIRSGQIDRRVLATLEFLAESGMRPTVSCLKTGHGFLTASGNVSEHSSGNAVDISAINGVPILGHQQHGGITEQAVRRLMRLQGTMRPHQIISLLDLGANTLHLADHYNHIHVGFQPRFGENRRLGRQTRAVLATDQWPKLFKRLNEIKNPVVPTKPSRYAVPTRRLHRLSKLP